MLTVLTKFQSPKKIEIELQTSKSQTNQDTIDYDNDFVYRFQSQKQLKSPPSSPPFRLLSKITSTNTPKNTHTNFNINNSSSLSSYLTYCSSSPPLQSNTNSSPSLPNTSSSLTETLCRLLLYQKLRIMILILICRQVHTTILRCKYDLEISKAQ